MTGVGPTPSKFKGGNIKQGVVFIKGVGNVSRNVYHGIKDNILNSVGKAKFGKIVGANPDIEVSKKTGEIILKWVNKGTFSSKSYNTGLKGSDFFNNYK